MFPPNSGDGSSEDKGVKVHTYLVLMNVLGSHVQPVAVKRSDVPCTWNWLRKAFKRSHQAV